MRRCRFSLVCSSLGLLTLSSFVQCRAVPEPSARPDPPPDAARPSPPRAASPSVTADARSGPPVTDDAGALGAAADSAAEVGVWPPKPQVAVQVDWCIPAVSVLDESSCYVLPDRPTRTLLIYLHGIVPPQKDSPQKTGFETVVANAARRAGVAALLPRGKKGLAPQGLSSWWGWPTGQATYRRHGAELVAQIADKRRLLESALGWRFERTYLAGSSSGAYFVAALALHGDFAADGYGAMSGGAQTPSAELSQLPPRPFYIGFGTQDTVGPAARALGALLTRAGWPVKVAVHATGHGAREVYLDEAFPFWAQHAP